MSTDQEKNNIIKDLLKSFNNKEIHLINHIVFYLKENHDGNDLYNNTRIELQNLEDLKYIDLILKKLLSTLSIYQLRIIKNNENFIYSKFIPFNQLREISKNKRLINIIKIKIENKSNNNINFDYKYIKETFHIPELELNDLLNFNEIIKLNKNSNEVIKDIMGTYSITISYKNNLDKYIENKEFLTWAINYLNNKHYFSHKYSPTTFDEHKETINKYFDNLFISKYLQYEKEINSLKKAWQQKQFRDQGKTKKEYHLPLTKQTKKELSNLAKFNNLSENAMLEKLIHQAYLSEICDEKGNPKY